MQGVDHCCRERSETVWQEVFQQSLLITQERGRERETGREREGEGEREREREILFWALLLMLLQSAMMTIPTCQAFDAAVWNLKLDARRVEDRPRLGPKLGPF